MNCEPCRLAAADPLVTSYGVGCLECAARAYAHAPDFLGRSQLQQVFGAGWQDGQRRVEQWRMRLAQACLQRPAVRGAEALQARQMAPE